MQDKHTKGTQQRNTRLHVMTREAHRRKIYGQELQQWQYGIQVGRTKKISEQKAATEALLLLKRNGFSKPVPELYTKYGTSSPSHK